MRFLALLEVFESRVIAIIVTQFTLLELLVVLHPIDKLISLLTVARVIAFYISTRLNFFCDGYF